MNIVFLVSDAFLGYGNFLYSLKAISSLQARLRKDRFSCQIYLLTGEKGKRLIYQLKGNIEFNVTVISIEEFNTMQNDPHFRVDYFLEGPVFDALIHRKLSIPDDVPVLLLPEYSVDVPESVIAYYSNRKRWHRDIIRSGFWDDKQTQGIFVTEELVAVAEDKKMGDFSFRNEYWPEVTLALSKQILVDRTIDQYHEEVELGFEYSANIDGTLYTTNACERYLRILQLYAELSKHYDVISIGKNTKAKKEAVYLVSSELIENGFTDIRYVNLETGEEELIYHLDTAECTRSFRLLHAPSISHRQMIAFLALSIDLIGVTGDQSFSEALSASKVIVYECLDHKEDLGNRFISSLSYAMKESTALEEDESEFRENAEKLATFLLSAPIDDRIQNRHERKKLGMWLTDPDVIAKYKEGCHQLIHQHNLANTIYAKIKSILFAELNDNIQLTIYRAIYQNDLVTVSLILTQESSVSLLHRGRYIASPLVYALEKNYFPLVKIMLEKYLRNGINFYHELELLDFVNYKDHHHLLIDIREKDMHLYRAIYLEKLRATYNEIAANYAKKDNFLRIQQLDVLKRIEKNVYHFANEEEAENVLIGGLLLIKKSIRKKSPIFSGSQLLKLVEQALLKLSIDSNCISIQEKAEHGLKLLANHDPALAENSFFVKALNEIYKFKVSPAPASILALTPNDIRYCQEIINRLDKREGVIKLTKNDFRLKKRGIEWSIIKFPNDEGFYFVDKRESALNDYGYFGKVEFGYYCDEIRRVHLQPVAMKIEKDKDPLHRTQEVSLFKQIHSHYEPQYYQSALHLRTNKSYSVFPKLPGKRLDVFLKDNSTLTLTERLTIFHSFIKALKQMHINQVTHRDIKLPNILYDECNREVHLIDFGFSEKFGTIVTFNDFYDIPCAMEYLPPDYYNGYLVTADKFDIYACVPVCWQILGLPLKALISNKLDLALCQLPDSPFKQALQAELETKNLEQALFSARSSCYDHPALEAFSACFSRVEFNLDLLKDVFDQDRIFFVLNSLLLSMASHDPEMRPSAKEIDQELIVFIDLFDSYINTQRMTSSC